ncbi:MAG: hypothetical protein Q8M65_00935, partial [Rhodoglobus sp.]|nr:hypothetical protein [Rhodoglobus sp.]
MDKNVVYLNPPVLARVRLRPPAAETKLPHLAMISPHVRARFVLLRGLFGLSVVVSVIPLEGQVAPSAPTGGASAAGELVKLSAFEVTSDKDKGYSSSHAVGATRTDTPLNELPQAISVINQQYIRDWVPDNVMEA